MKAVVAHAFGPPETFALETRPLPQPGPGAVRIAIAAAGVSFVDGLIAEGRYQLKPALPFTPGTEFSGLVDAVGEGVTSLEPGDRVAASSFGGAFATHAVVPAAVALKCPPGMRLIDAAVFRVSYSAAYYALARRGRLAPGETVLVLGAGGAVGCAGVQVARALGARVIASASTPEKRALALSVGADAAVDSGSGTWRQEIAYLTDGQGTDIVFDPVGGPLAEPAVRTLGWGGRFLVIGFASGGIPRLPLNLPLLKGAEIVGVDVRQFGERDPGGLRESLATLFDFYAAGQVRPAIAHHVPLAGFAEAMTLARQGTLAGRIVLTMQNVIDG